jgi:hypothetical protein
MNIVIQVFTPYILSLAAFLLFMCIGVFLINKGAQAAPKKLPLLKSFWKWKTKYPFFSVYSLFQLIYVAFTATIYCACLAGFFEKKLLIIGLLLIFTFQCYVWSIRKFQKINQKVNSLLISTAFLLVIYAVVVSFLSTGGFIIKLLIGALVWAAFLLGLSWLHKYYFRKKAMY